MSKNLIINKMKIKELLNLPKREWGAETIYYSIIVVNSKRKHDSGWAWMAIIGLDEKQKPIEIAAYCDSICWDFNGLSFKNDMFYPSGILHFWSREAKFKVGASLSSTDITLIKKER